MNVHQYNRLMLILLITIFVSSVAAKEYKLYYLGGQSNMDGYGSLNELPKDLKVPLKGVMIFHGNTAKDGEAVDGKGIWAGLRPGHGVGFKSDGSTNIYSERFGVEITFVRRLLELNPNENVAIIKYSKGGTSIDLEAAGRFGCWDADFSEGNGINQYDHFLATVRNALSIKDINGDGEADRLIPAGIVWMQGESDAAYTAEIAHRYQANLRQLMDLIRAAFRVDDLPVVIGKISDSGQDEDGKVWDYGEIVRRAQAAFVEKDRCAAIVTSTDNYGYSDKWHYNSAGYIDLGKRFAETIAGLGGCN